MSDIVITAEHLSKSYLVGHRSARRERHPTLRDMLVREARNFGRKAADFVRGRQIVQGDEVEEFWALKDVSFEVGRGEVVGIIGRNGAGKSTLLKILARITEPTEGRVTIRGRVASLLEVGTGFHPELSGRENIFLNGAILGMTRAEIKRKFDEIVAFAEVERFLDTPVKRYSSGMYVRLAFAVAAHLEPEILVVDEVLSVGDAEFQKRCLGKMSEVAGGGRTVLFVSHNMGAVKALCGRGVVLQNGRTAFDGSTEQAISQHLRRSGLITAIATERTWSPEEAPGSDDFRLRRVRLTGEKSAGPIFQPDEAINVLIAYDQTRPLSGMRIVLQVQTLVGEIAFTTTDQAWRGETTYSAGAYEVTCRIPGELLNTLQYIIRLWAGIPGKRYLLDPVDLLTLSIDGAGNQRSLYSRETWPGVICPAIKWDVKERAALDA
jgi:lipopolysaccharide transport system ATP-binding protein